MSHYSLPLFPLNTVVFPEGMLSLKIFETRFMDMVRDCLRSNSHFGVVALYPGNQLNVQSNFNVKPQFPFANVGTCFTILDADVTYPGLINVRCVGKQKFKVHSAKQQKDGLWIAEVENMDNEANMQIPDDLQITKTHLQRIIYSLSEQDMSELELPIAKPYKLQDCAWVANRWCEILNIPLIQKQRMLELDSPLVRLELIQDMLRKEFSDD